MIVKYKSKNVHKPCFKKWILVLISIVSVYCLFIIPIYNKWYNDKILTYYHEFRNQIKSLNYENRYLYRFGKNYRLNQNLKNYFSQNEIEDPVLLLPPKEYLKRNKDNYDWGETLSFYYFTGIRPVDLKSGDISEATHALIASEYELKIIDVSDEALLNRVIGEYRKYNN